MPSLAAAAPSGGFCLIIPSEVSELAIPMSHKLTYGALTRYRGRDGRCFPAHSTIARATGISVRSVQRALTTLRKLGFLDWMRKNGSSNSYTFPSPGSQARAAEGPASADEAQAGAAATSAAKASAGTAAADATTPAAATDVPQAGVAASAATPATPAANGRGASPAKRRPSPAADMTAAIRAAARVFTFGAKEHEKTAAVEELYAASTSIGDRAKHLARFLNANQLGGATFDVGPDNKAVERLAGFGEPAQVIRWLLAESYGKSHWQNAGMLVHLLTDARRKGLKLDPMLGGFHTCWHDGEGRAGRFELSSEHYGYVCDGCGEESQLPDPEAAKAATSGAKR